MPLFEVVILEEPTRKDFEEHGQLERLMLKIAFQGVNKVETGSGLCGDK